MYRLIRLALWNANGVTLKRKELSFFLSENHVALKTIPTLLSINSKLTELQITEEGILVGGAHGGTAVLIRMNMTRKEGQTTTSFESTEVTSTMEADQYFYSLFILVT